MIKTTAKIDGMMCGMCEAHVNDAVRAKLDVKKVTSSHSKGETVIVAQEAVSEAELADALASTGYRVLGVTSEPYEKKGFFGRK